MHLLGEAPSGINYIHTMTSLGTVPHIFLPLYKSDYSTETSTNGHEIRLILVHESAYGYNQKIR